MRPGLNLVAGAAVALSLVASVLVGPAGVSAGALWAAATGRLAADALPALVLIEIRLPRAVLAALVGAALGIAGAALQGLVRNPLAEPGLLGVTSGAALGAVLALYFGLSAVSVLATPVAGLLGAFVATAMVLGVARGAGVLVLVLAGAAVSALASAGVALALNLAPNPWAVFEMSDWLLGSVADRGWDHVALAAPFIAAGIVLLMLHARPLDALALGELHARALGVDTGRVRLAVMAGTALAVGAATAVAGAIGFVGLVAAHLVRPLVGHEPRRVLLPAALVGAALVLWADIAVRLIPVASGTDIKLGVLAALLGAPFLLWLIAHLRRGQA
jgi:iron complex transport system permease protein